MDDYDDPTPRERREYPVPVSKMSKVPSWVSLGFVLGALFVIALPKPKPAPPEVKIVEVVRPPAAETKLTTVEAVFAAWREYAVWHDDLTEIAYWNPGTQEFSEFYEVWRVADREYFRSIPRLTRRLISHGKEPPPECPLRFTETEAQYREWRDFGRRERPTAPTAPARATPVIEVATPPKVAPPPVKAPGP